ncbi:hypothetical protein EW026_g5678 [Hermanssonia centrifuga]|uniref:Carrier domain-containing protein n=1 Tax=Hermanssonia centrifuga TaxID=98765 RepID=A0A4S4KDD0_9APHY|nr:hypothetical protein EW026_g5678 [Hermanssonia centrifuga]
MFGRGRPQAGIIVEPHPSHIVDTSDEAGIIAFRNKIWPIVEEANASAPSFGRIFKEMIIVTEPTKPLPRAAKGTVIRKLAIASYSDSIDQLYKTIEDSADSKGISPPESWSVGDIEAWLHKHAASLNEDRELDSSADLFEAGFDSLSATFLRNRIIGALRVSNDTAVQEAVRGVSQNFIFDHPTITELATAIYTLVYPSLAPVAEKDKTKHIRDLIEKYSAGLPKRSSAVATSNKTSFVVVLTGSTGNIGSHILASLLSDGRIARVYTLDRDSSSSGPWERQKFAFEDRGLPVELLSHRKLSSLVGDLNAPMFGLKPELYQEIANTVTHFIHNAWKVNFNHALNSFEAQISGTRKLLDLCFSSTRPIRVLFTSSVSVAHGWDVVNGPVPEESLPNPELAVSTGYASSKYVTEQLLTKAAENGLETTILRVGQVCGSKATGAWNVTDWVPIFVKSSLAIGCLPELEGCVSWIPMDAVADTVLDLIVSPNDPSLVLNVVHPRPSPWNDVIKAINEELRQRLPLVPYAQWIGKLEVLSADPDPQQLENIPALKLLEFFRGIGASDSSISDKTNVEAGGMPLYETRELQRQSETARTLSPLNEDYSRMWVKYWRSKGLLL